MAVSVGNPKAHPGKHCYLRKVYVRHQSLMMLDTQFDYPPCSYENHIIRHITKLILKGSLSSHSGALRSSRMLEKFPVHYILFYEIGTRVDLISIYTIEKYTINKLILKVHKSSTDQIS